MRLGDHAGAAHAYSAAITVDPRGGLGARLNRLVALLGVCAWGDASTDGAAMLATPSEALTAEQTRKVRLRTAAALAQLGRFADAVTTLAAGISDDASGADAEWSSFISGVSALSEAELLKAQAASAAAAGDLPVSAGLLSQALIVAPGHLRVALNACSVALAAGDVNRAAAALARATSLLDSVPEGGGAVDGVATAWLLGGIPPRRSPAYAQMRAELDIRSQALDALRQQPDLSG